MRPPPGSPLENTTVASIRPELIDPSNTLIRWKDVCALTGLARITIYKIMERDSSFPRPVPLTDSKSRGAPVGFVLGEVQAWIQGRIAAREAKVKGHDQA